MTGNDKRRAIIMCAVKHIIMRGMTTGCNCHGKHASYNARGGGNKTGGIIMCEESTL